jgi:hypothetical protein
MGITQIEVARRSGLTSHTNIPHMFSPNHHASIPPAVQEAIIDLLTEAGYGRRRAQALFAEPVVTSDDAKARAREATRRYRARKAGQS